MQRILISLNGMCTADHHLVNPSLTCSPFLTEASIQHWKEEFFLTITKGFNVVLDIRHAMHPELESSDWTEPSLNMADPTRRSGDLGGLVWIQQMTDVEDHPWFFKQGNSRSLGPSNKWMMQGS